MPALTVVAHIHRAASTLIIYTVVLVSFLEQLCSLPLASSSPPEPIIQVFIDGSKKKKKQNKEKEIPLSYEMQIRKSTLQAVSGKTISSEPNFL